MTFNQQQIMTAVGTVTTIAGILAVSTGTLSQDQWTGLSAQLNSVIGGVLTLVGMAVTLWQQRQASQVIAASNVDGVQVHVNRSAPEAVKALVSDPTAKDVVPMGPSGPVIK